MRYRSSRVRSRADRDAHRAAAAHRREEPADPRSRIGRRRHRGWRRCRAEALEVAMVVDPTSTDGPGLLREETEGLGVDVAIDCSGHASGCAAAVGSLRRRGALAQTGLFVGEASVEPMLWSLNDLTIVGTWCYWVYDFGRIAAQIGAGTLPVERVVTSTGALDDAPDAFARLASGSADEIKVLIER